MAYQGFKKLEQEVADQPGVKNPAGLAAAIGRRKYGGKKMAKAAATGHTLRNAVPIKNRKYNG